MKRKAKKLIEKQVEYLNREAYTVRFWVQKDNGFWEQKEDVFKCPKKGQHDKAERLCKDKYGDKIKIISVLFQ